MKYARVVLSGYANPIYERLEGFTHDCFEVKTTTGTHEKKGPTFPLELPNRVLAMWLQR